MKTDEIRRRFLDFFVHRGHVLFPSDSLVPEGDASILFTGAGMNQFKDAFLGKGPPGLQRATSCQKCMRMPDLENVGRTPSHHTFFEMLGNFSFGDYFKREAITWAMQFLEGELGLPRERLAVTVFQDDDEAAAIWRDDVGMPASRIFRCGEADNFWPAEAPSKGPNGPCGPCSEIYFDFGVEKSTARGGPSEPATDPGRFVEVWNLVFTQYDRQGPQQLVPLPRKNIDTGMGLERITRVMQDKATNFEIDVFVPLLERIGALTGRRFGKDAAGDARMKRIADHARAATFCIADGVRPSNEGRGYVVRKVIRRASMDLLELGHDRPGVCEVVPAIAAVMGDAYPELKERAALIRDVIRGEEERFAEVYRTGSTRLAVMLDELERGGTRELPGAKAFFLWDTVGFPFDITRRYCEEHGFTVDEAGFEREMGEQRDRGRAGSQISEDIFASGPASQLKGRVAPTVFTGYDRLVDEAVIAAILGPEGRALEQAGPADGAVSVVLDRSPFYAESGGQVGDTGLVEAAGGGAALAVSETSKAGGFHLHEGTVQGGTLRVGQPVRALVDARRRHDTMRNHTATHLLHWALREVLGEQTTQAGSLVHPDYLRFDYTAAGAPAPEQLERVEDLVNRQILADLTVDKQERSFEDARREGAIALFGEKYGDRVRVVRVVDEVHGRDQDSVELCGGTHCSRTGQIGLFKILGDASIAAGVRRITAVTGAGALRHARSRFQTAGQLSDLLKVQEDELVARVESLLADKSRLEKELARRKRDAALAGVESIRGQAVDLGDGGALHVRRLEGLGVEELRSLADRLLEGAPDAVCVLAGVDGDKVSLVVACGPDAVKRGIKAGEISRALGKRLGGGGGGRPDMAQGQGKDVAGLDAALREVEAEVRARWSRAAAG